MEMWCTPCLGHVRQVSISCLIHGSSSQRLSHTCCHLSTSIFCAKRDASSGHEVPEIGLGFLAAELVPRGDISYH